MILLRSHFFFFAIFFAIFITICVSSSVHASDGASDGANSATAISFMDTSLHILITELQDNIYPLLGILLLLICSGFFSGAETAITAASAARLKSLETEGVSGAGRANQLLERRERLVNSLLLGNNFVNILASALAASLFIKWFGDSGVVWATILMTLLVLVFAESLPKTYAINRADNLVLTFGPALKIVATVLGPIASAVIGIVRVTLRVFQVQGVPLNLGVDPDELRGTIELHQTTEDDPDADRVLQEQRMLRSILDLDNVTVEEIMVYRNRIIMLDADIRAYEGRKIAVGLSHSRLPLFKDQQDNIVGVLHVKSLLDPKITRNSTLTLGELATPPWYIPETTSLLEQLREFRARHEHFALVVDEYGELKGIVTLEDILEEIVGDIHDESDEPVAGVTMDAEGNYIIEGKVTIRDLNRQLDWGLPDDRAATLAGLVMYEAQRIPEPGQEFHFFGFEFLILERERHQITSLRVTVPLNSPLAGAHARDTRPKLC